MRTCLQVRLWLCALECWVLDCLLCDRYHEVRRLAKLEEDARRQQEAAAAAAQRAANAEGKAEVLQKALQKAEERAATLEMQARARPPRPRPGAPVGAMPPGLASC